MRASRNVSNRIISVVCPPEPSTTRVLTGLVRFFRLEDCCCCCGQFDSSSQRIDFTTYATRSAKAVSPETVAAAAGLSRHSDEADIVVIDFGWCFTIHHAYSVKSAQYELCNRDGNLPAPSRAEPPSPSHRYRARRPRGEILGRHTDVRHGTAQARHTGHGATARRLETRASDSSAAQQREQQAVRSAERAKEKGRAESRANKAYLSW